MGSGTKKYGLLAGVLAIGYLLLFYLVNRALILNPAVYWSSVLFYLVCMYKACLSARSGYGGLLTFSDGLRTAFTVFLIANLLFYLFYYLLFNYIDPDLVALQEASFRQFAEMMNPEEARPMLEAMEKQGFEMTLTATLFGYAKGAIGGFVLALIVAAVTKRG